MSAGIMLAGTLICFIIPDVLIGLFTNAYYILVQYAKLHYYIEKQQ